MLVTKLRKVQHLSWVDWPGSRIPLLVLMSQLEVKAQGQNTDESREGTANCTSLHKIRSIIIGQRLF